MFAGEAVPEDPSAKVLIQMEFLEELVMDNTGASTRKIEGVSEYVMVCDISNIIFESKTREDAAREVAAYSKRHNFEKYTHDEHIQGMIDAVNGEDWDRKK